MLYGICYSANKERRKIAEQKLEKFGSVSIPMGIIGCYFIDLDIAEEIALELTDAHFEDGIDYEVIPLENLKEQDVNKNLIIRSSEEYHKFCNRKYKKSTARENNISL